MTGSDATLSELLERWNAGDREAAAQLLPLVYDDVRAIARSHFRRERGSHTLQPTAAVHEAYLRLGASAVEIHDRQHLIALLARTMRQVLIDYSRERNAAKRGGGSVKVTLSGLEDALPSFDGQVLELHAALERLERIDAAKGKLVELRFFAGLSIEEAAEQMGVSVSTANREWRKARAWLIRELTRHG